METVRMIMSNYYIDVAFFSWLAAQVLKTLLTFALTKEIVWERMVGAGGMPSAHSAQAGIFFPGVCPVTGIRGDCNV